MFIFVRISLFCDLASFDWIATHSVFEHEKNNTNTCQTQKSRTWQYTFNLFKHCSLKVIYPAQQCSKKHKTHGLAVTQQMSTITMLDDSCLQNGWYETGHQTSSCLFKILQRSLVARKTRGSRSVKSSRSEVFSRMTWNKQLNHDSVTGTHISNACLLNYCCRRLILNQSLPRKLTQRFWSSWD